MRCKITNVKISKKYQGYDQRRLGVEISSVSFYDIVIDGHFFVFYAVLCAIYVEV